LRGGDNMDEKKNETGKVNLSNLDNDKLFAILAYFLFFIPILAAKNSKLAMFHANQSLILLIIWVVVWFVSAIIPLIGAVISMIVGLGVLVLWVMGVLSAAKGEMKPLPLIGSYTLIK